MSETLEPAAGPAPATVHPIAPVLRLPALLWVVLVVLAIATTTTAVSAGIAAHNTRQICEQTVPAWPGQAGPCL